jgi:hypothetical protein
MKGINMKEKIKLIPTLILFLIIFATLGYLFVIRFFELQYNDTYFAVVHWKEMLLIFSSLFGVVIVQGKK